MTIESNDPLTPVVTVALAGEGLPPPVISVAPESLRDSLLTAETSVQTMTISNTGSNDLLWTAQLAQADGAAQQYTLTVPNAEPVTMREGDIKAPNVEIRTTTITATLQNLVGVNIMWDRSHGQSSTVSWSTIVADVTARGCDGDGELVDHHPDAAGGC